MKITKKIVGFWLNLWHNRLFRFFFIGCINTLFTVSLITILLFIKLPYKMAVLIGTVIGVVFNFKTIGVFVFRNVSNLLFVKFVLVYIVTYLINITLITIIKKYGINSYFSVYISALPVAIITYILHKKFVYCKTSFRKNNPNTRLSLL